MVLWGTPPVGALAASLGVDGGLLNDNVAGLDRDRLALVLAAVSHVGGSHEHGPIAILFDDAGQPYRNPTMSVPGRCTRGRKHVGGSR